MICFLIANFKTQVVKIVKKARFYAINKAIALQPQLWFIRVCLIKKKERKTWLQ